ncbi:undecaprenyldiphospho-muramoylpentapeptide beta-N-acetylglucosaminyltransferase [Puia dinghuensis]|uniref:UDP-N-acetylglucosamine--N-acetylmuramyl-(pentapeptide) pyrophosphoryl-undecaprenol N-acetylglucosamine transferase n=1 Tax=Puia dinghuensis TaxID=1792502 RepID=A0A8J2UEA0_9BACT|nr:undecaprenyldiphospho-muramoylpentapeptide beta-N-acetylglucosaminyltransferase [Puia dinghuensis]GGB05787.1 UDP-N-acetylglucosamine--N-acetylmuramyl-(pentapeptide) pyrophosphoryl-undecaprenol N-acetylglucosamine transferase [Puia dinghuensis]
MNKRIIIAGGGTGGHIFPAIAIAGALKQQDPSIEILFVGAQGKMEMEKVPQAGYKIEGITIAGFNRSSLIKNIGLPFKLIKSFFQVNRILRSFMPDAVVGVGGYSSFPVLRSAQAKGIPTFIHESNSFAGKSNILLGKKATHIFVATDGMEKFFPAGRISVVGNPVRSTIVQSKVTREEGIRFFGLDPAKQTVLSTGGSLGAKGINEAIAAHLDGFEKNGLQLIWQTGKPFAEQAASLSAGHGNIWTHDFIAQMEYAFAAADIVISRSGAMSIAELCVVQKPVVFVPFPFAAEDHQTANAQNLVNKKAGLLVKDSEAKDKLVDTVLALSKDTGWQTALKTNIGRLAITDAGDRIAGEILKEIALPPTAKKEAGNG